MLTSLITCFDEFRKQFGDTLNVPVGNGSTAIPVRWSRETLARTRKEDYPVCYIHDYPPEINPTFSPTPEKRIDAFRDPVIDKPGQYATATIFKDPIAFILRYDVGVYVKNPMQRLAVLNYFYATYELRGTMMYNAVTIDGYQEIVGDPVLYTMTVNEQERNDGVYELIFSFAVNTRVAIQTPVDVTLLETLNINNNPMQLTYTVVDNATTLTLVVERVVGAKWFTVSAVPDASLGDNGDYAINSVNGDYYSKVTGSWVLQGNLQGAVGVNGNRWFSGSGAPSNALGNDNDFYLDRDNGDVYEKTGGTWV